MNIWTLEGQAKTSAIHYLGPVYQPLSRLQYLRGLPRDPQPDPTLLPDLSAIPVTKLVICNDIALANPRGIERLIIHPDQRLIASRMSPTIEMFRKSAANFSKRILSKLLPEIIGSTIARQYGLMGSRPRDSAIPGLRLPSSSLT